MQKESPFYCPECDDGTDHSQHQSRRQFMGVVGAGAVAAAAGGALPVSPVSAVAPPPAQRRRPVPAEGLIRELYESMSNEQRQNLVFPWNHGTPNNPTRQRTFNSAFQNRRIAENYTRPQQDLVRRIFRSILSGDEAAERISRNGRWDSSGSFEGCGAVIFGEPGDDTRFAWVFSGHHLTLRCDGNSETNTAFGGPVYYGHSTPGYSQRNVYYYQTEQVQSVFDSLNERQQRQAIATNNPGDGLRGVQFREEGERPGIAYADLSRDQKDLVVSVMRTLLAPYRQDDADEVMRIVRMNGGIEQINLAYYADRGATDNRRWHFWRLEGPGFVWNYRPLPHVHCFVNIANVTRG